jgi:hypothetical protein
MILTSCPIIFSNRYANKGGRSLQKVSSNTPFKRVPPKIVTTQPIQQKRIENGGVRPHAHHFSDFFVRLEQI